MRFTFPITNNVFEYETLLTSLDLAKKIRARHVIIYVDGQLIDKKITAEYEAKEPLIFSYYQEVQARLSEFTTDEIRKIRKEQNAKVDALSKLAVTDDDHRIRVMFEI